MRNFELFKRPILTEKTYAEMNSMSKYTFEVSKDANKREIAVTFEQVFKVKPVKVNVIVYKPAKTRTGTKFPGSTRLMKKAIITLPAGTKLNILGDEEQPTEEKE